MKEQDLIEIREAKEAVKNNRDLILKEMEERGAQGKLWRNGMCDQWFNYQASIKKLDRLREIHGV